MHANLLDEFQQILHERVATDGIAGGMGALPEKVVETVSPPPEVVKLRAGRGNLSGILVLSSLAVVSMITFSYLATLMRVHEKQVEKAELVEQLDDTGSDEEYDEEEYLAEENEGEQLPDEAPEETAAAGRHALHRDRGRVRFGGGRQVRKKKGHRDAKWPTRWSCSSSWGPTRISSTGRT